MGRKEMLDRKAKALEVKKARDEKKAKQKLIKKAKDAGLLYEEVEIPPDEVTVVKGTWTSLMSLIPYTQAYYEASTAEEELDNLTKIRIEKAKAEDLLAMAKTGYHEEALQSMMAETNNDFFYFNKLREKMEAEGKYHYDEIDLDLFSGVDKQNRIRKAANEQCKFITPELKLHSITETPGKKRTKDKIPCSWRGKNLTGETLQCKNNRFIHPLNKEVLAFCCYHNLNCVGAVHPEKVKIKILFPNSLSLCSECYSQLNKSKPPKLSLSTVPGVCSMDIPTIATGKQDLMMEKALEEGQSHPHPTKGANEKGETVEIFTKQSICNWKPNKDEIHFRGYECTCKVKKDPLTKLYLPTCGMHVRKCLKPHSSSASDLITIPNLHGLCVMHYLAEFGTPPERVPFPYPGMRPKLGKRANVFGAFKTSHWFAPQFAPQSDILTSNYYEPPPPPSMMNQFFDWVSYQWDRYKFEK